MSGVWVAAGTAVAGAYANYESSEAQAEAQQAAADAANAPYYMKEPHLQSLYNTGGQAMDSAQELSEDPKLQQSYQQQHAVAQNLQNQGYGQQVQQLGQNILSGQYMDPSQNRYLQGAMSAATDPVTQEFQRKLMPQMSSDAVGAGQYGSSRQGVIEANAMNDLSRNILNTRSQMAYQNYADERQRQMQAPQMIQAGTEMALTPGQITQSVNQAQQQNEFAGTSQMGSLLGVGPNQQVAAQPGPNSMQSAISGGIGGASTAAGIMSALGSNNNQQSMNTQTGWNQSGSPGYGGYGNNTSWYTGMGNSNG